jgi:O-methyltransferase involved in polyketide biosynthesis
MEDATATAPTAWHDSNSTSHDDALIMGTAEDAVKAKHAAVQTGYYQDPYIGAFAQLHTPASSSQLQNSVQVIIKRGTYARVECIRKVIAAFLDTSVTAAKRVQVIVLGSGKDTSFFRVLDDLRSKDQGGLRWFEVDHDDVLREKAAQIERSPSIFGASVRKAGNMYTLQSANNSNSWPATCHLIAHDLREGPETLVRTKLVQAGMDPSQPTLVVSECVQMYLPLAAVTNLLKVVTATCSDCIFCSYEPILGSNSAFGRMMQENLTKAGVVQPGSCLVEIRTLQQTLSNLHRTGFLRAVGCDMYEAYETVLSVKQRASANRCEFLDELEEFMLIMRHYCFLVACNNVQSEFGQQMCAIGSSSLLGFIQGRCEEL